MSFHVISIKRCNSTCEDFIELIKELDNELNAQYGEQQKYYNQYNVIPYIDTVVIAYVDKKPAGCGCFKKYDNDTVEIKRMYAKPENRGKGISGQVLTELEKWALELGFTKTVLETGIKQIAAIGLYTKNGYSRIENYGQYAGLPSSVCFAKSLKK